MLLPRVAALAEVQWLPVNKKDYDAFHKRLTRLARLYDRYGYTYALHACLKDTITNALFGNFDASNLV